MSKHYEQRKAANARWAAKQERFCMYLDPEDKAAIAAYAKSKRESMTAFLLRCAKAEMERNPITAVRYERYATANQITQHNENE